MAIFVLVVSIVMTYMFKVQSELKRLSNVLTQSRTARTSEVFATRLVMWQHLENKSLAKNKKKYEFTILLLVIFQSCSSSLM